MPIGNGSEIHRRVHVRFHRTTDETEHAKTIQVGIVHNMNNVDNALELHRLLLMYISPLSCV